MSEKEADLNLISSSTWGHPYILIVSAEMEATNGIRCIRLWRLYIVSFVKACRINVCVP